MGKALLWVLVAVVALWLLGSFFVSLIGGLIKLAFFLLLGVLVVGGVLYVFSSIRRGVGGNRRRQINR